MKLLISKLVNNTGQIEGLPANPRTINKDDYKKLLKSLQDDPDFLNHKPLHVYEHDGKYIVLGGNQRLKALKELGHKDVPVTIYDPETPVEVLKRRIIVDNSTFGDYDMDMLANEWDDEPLDDWGVDLPDDWLKQEDEVVEDEAPEVDESEPPKSKLGEVYQLGRHKIICGSATEESDVAKLIGGKQIECIFTDPPYGVSYKSKKLGSIKNDDLAGDDLYEFIRDSFENVIRLSTSEVAVYCWYEDKYRNIFQRAIEDSGYEFKQNLIWNKGMNLSGADYQKAHENCMYFQKKGHKAHWYGGRDKKTILGLRRRDIEQMKKSEMIKMFVAMQKESTVWDYDRDTVTTYVHPTQKPVVLSANALMNSTNDGDVVLDMFAGSGSTLIGAEQTGRVAYLVEYDPKFVDVIRKRYWRFVNDNNVRS